jgi:hypothetical protein
VSKAVSNSHPINLLVDRQIVKLRTDVDDGQRQPALACKHTVNGGLPRASLKTRKVGSRDLDSDPVAGAKNHPDAANPDFEDMPTRNR